MHISTEDMSLWSMHAYMVIYTYVVYGRSYMYKYFFIYNRSTERCHSMINVCVHEKIYTHIQTTDVHTRIHMHISAAQPKVISLWIYICQYKKTTQLVYLDKSSAN